MGQELNDKSPDWMREWFELIARKAAEGQSEPWMDEMIKVVEEG